MIRPFKEEDAKATSNLIIRNLKEINSKDYSKEIIEKFCEKYSPEKLIEMKKDIYVYEKEEEIIGTGTIEDNYINAVYVLPEEQRKGVGKQIVNFLESKSKKPWIKLHSTINSLEFYNKLGYTIHHKVEGKSNGTTYFMVKGELPDLI